MSTQCVSPIPSKMQLKIAEKACAACNAKYPGTIIDLGKIVASYSVGTFLLVLKYTQAGKSVLQRALVHLMSDLVPVERIGVIMVQNKSSSTLKVMTEEGMLDNAGFESTDLNDGVLRTIDSKVFVGSVMLSGGAVSKADPWGGKSRIIEMMKILRENYGCTKIAFVMDEVHIGTGWDTQVSALVKYLGSLHHAGPIFGFTATPQIFLEGELDRTSSTSVLYLPPGDGYYGLDKIMNTRYKPFEGFTIAECMAKFPKTPGYIICRVSKKSNEAVQNIETVCRTAGIPCLIYTSDKCKSKQNNVFEISKLKGRLAEDPRGSKVIIIKDALSAGDDLVFQGANLRKYISAWFEDRFSSPAAAAQSLGRLTGYNVTDTFQVFLTDKVRDAALEHIEYMDEIKDHRIPEVQKKRNAKSSKIEADWDSISTGSYDEYLNTFKHPGKRPGKAKEHSSGLLVNFEKGILRADSVRFFDVSNPSTDPAEVSAAKRLRRKYKVKAGNGLWFRTLKVKHQAHPTKSVLQHMPMN